MAHSFALKRSSLHSWCDRGIGSLVIALVVIPPLLVGAVYPLTYSAIEAAIFLGLILWMGLVLLDCEQLPLLSRSLVRGITTPLLLLLGLCGFQLLPLPPAVLRLVSPATYQVYAQSLDGWPGQQPYAWLAPLKTQSAFILPTPDQAKAGIAIQVQPDSASSGPGGFTAGILEPTYRTWRSVSLTPSLTRSSLLKLGAYVILLYLIALYPFRSAVAEAQFTRRTVNAVLLSGLVLASIGIIERATWNGKVLWTLIPYQSIDIPPVPRAQGPFVNPNHFGNYLAMILPLAGIVSLWPRTLSEASSTVALRIFAFLTSLVVFAALLMSMSRAALIGTMCGIVVLGLLVRHAGTELYGTGLLARHKMVSLSVGIALVLLLAIPLTGSSGIGAAADRFAQIVSTKAGRDDRLPLWQDAARMVKDFPVTGVGFGCFAELFARYQRPPWSPVFWDTSNNDALQSAIELGLPGLLLMLWCAVAVLWRLVFSLRFLTVHKVILIGAILAGIVATAVHEFVDFPLQIPANALLLSVISGLALRIAGTSARQIRIGSRSGNRLIAGAVTLGAVGLAAAALRQGRVPFPFDIQAPSTPQEARALILTYPGRSRAHLFLLERFGSTLNAAQRMLELKRTLWLEPTNPLARDLYALELREQGHKREAMAEISRSMFLSPALEQHWYLTEQSISRLTTDESAAINQGLTAAFDAHLDGAVSSLGYFLRAQGKPAAAAALFARAATFEPDPAGRLSLILASGEAYAECGDTKHAEAEFRAAIATAPGDPRAYTDLITLVFVTRHDTKAASSLVAQGVQNGADPAGLYDALAQAEKAAGNWQAAAAAWQQALAYDPTYWQAPYSVGLMYLQRQDFEPAINALRQAAQIQSGNSEIYYYLAVAEDQAYKYFDADRDYARAAALAPDNSQFQDAYAAFKRKVAQNAGAAS